MPVIIVLCQLLDVMILQVDDHDPEFDRQRLKLLRLLQRGYHKLDFCRNFVLVLLFNQLDSVLLQIRVQLAAYLLL